MERWRQSTVLYTSTYASILSDNDNSQRKGLAVKIQTNGSISFRITSETVEETIYIQHYIQKTEQEMSYVFPVGQNLVCQHQNGTPGLVFLISENFTRVTGICNILRHFQSSVTNRSTETSEELYSESGFRSLVVMFFIRLHTSIV